MFGDGPVAYSYSLCVHNLHPDIPGNVLVLAMVQSLESGQIDCVYGCEEKGQQLLSASAASVDICSLAVLLGTSVHLLFNTIIYSHGCNSIHLVLSRLSR